MKDRIIQISELLKQKLVMDEAFQKRIERRLEILREDIDQLDRNIDADEPPTLERLRHHANCLLHDIRQLERLLPPFDIE